MQVSGIVVLSIFAAVWWIAGVHLADLNTSLPYAVALISIFLIAVARRHHSDTMITPQERIRRRRAISIASTVEGVAIFLVANVLANVGRPDLIAAATGIIVGLHFVPLAASLHLPLYYVTALLLSLVGVAGLFAQLTHCSPTLVCFCAALILWATAAIGLRMNWNERPEKDAIEPNRNTSS